MSTKHLLLLLVLFMLGNLVVSAQDEGNDLFTVYPDAIVTNGATGEWDHQYTDPGAVFYHNGLFHMFRNGFNGWPAPVKIGYMTSEDGINWTEVSQEPVFTSAEVEFAGIAALASSALVEDDGTWVLYFYTWETSSQWPGPGDIGRATASDPLGPWRVDEAPVLTRGGEGAWDAVQVATPSVIKTDDGYMMYYTGYMDSGATAIGLATSADGITWTKHNDPTTDEAPYAESDPVLVAELEWEQPLVHQPRVVLEGDQNVMVYRAMGTDFQTHRLGLATSEDGVIWEKFADNPVFATEDLGAQFGGMFFVGLVYQEETYYLYVEGGMRNTTTIYVATYEGSLLEE